MTGRGRAVGVGIGLVLLGVVTVVALGLAANPPAAGTGAGLEGELVVSGAASTAAALDELAALFEEMHPGVEVVLNLGGSATLAEQVRGGAPADVLLSASGDVVQDLAAEGLVDEVAVVATNDLRVAVPVDGEVAVARLADLEGEPYVGLCAVGQPCGDYARTVLVDQGLDPEEVADTAEPDAGALLRRLASGELDAAIVYRSDLVAGAGEVRDADVELEGPIARYVAAVIAEAPAPEAAAAFLDLLAGEEGQRVLADNGFGPAP